MTTVICCEHLSGPDDAPAGSATFRVGTYRCVVCPSCARDLRALGELAATLGDGEGAQTGAPNAAPEPL